MVSVPCPHCLLRYVLGGDAQELQAFHQRQREELDEKENERIFDVIRGDARRRKAAGQEDTWVPNRAARKRGMPLGHVPAGFSGAMAASQDDDLDDGLSGDVGADRAAERLERLKWLQERRQLEVEQAQQDLQEQDADAVEHRADADGATRAPIRRFHSRTAPALVAFSRQLSGVNPNGAPKAPAAASAGGDTVEEVNEAVSTETGDAAKRWRKLNAVMKLTRSYTCSPTHLNAHLATFILPAVVFVLNPLWFGQAGEAIR